MNSIGVADKMVCESESANIPAKLHTPSPPSTPPHPPRSGVSHDACFRCKRQGHWAVQCPTKTTKNSEASSPGSASDLPVVRCRCGVGSCSVRTSMTTGNPGRKFFTCPNNRSPEARGCGFFKWCDQVKAPLCPCGAGICSYNRESGGPQAGRWYFACRIKKNHGACQFFQWEDSPMETAMSRQVEKSKEHSCQSQLASQQVFSNETIDSGNRDCLSPVMESRSDEIEFSENPEHAPIMMIDSYKEVCDRDIVIQKLKHWGPMIGEVLFHGRTAAGGLLTEGVIYQISHNFHGWLGRLAFPPLQCLKDVDMSNVESSRPRLPTPREELQLSSVICREPSGPKSPSSAVLRKDVSVAILKRYGEALLQTLESMEPHDHKEMLKVAEVTFALLDSLSVNYGLFSEAVKEYISCLSRLTEIDRSTNTAISSEELINIYNSEKVDFDNVSQLHDEIANVYQESEASLKLLSEEVSVAKERLSRLERELSDCEAECLVLRTRYAEISDKKSESERKMEAAYENIKQALELEEEREAVLVAAMGALQIGRIQLQQ